LPFAEKFYKVLAYWETMVSHSKEWIKYQKERDKHYDKRYEKGRRRIIIGGILSFLGSIIIGVGIGIVYGKILILSLIGLGIGTIFLGSALANSW
jgi:hypothetical protein